jgi:hypothetical protein
MAALSATLRLLAREPVPAGEIELEASLVNGSSEPVGVDLGQVSLPSLVLEVRDAADREVLLRAPPVPDEAQLGAHDLIAAGDRVSVRHAGFLDARLAPGTYRIRYAGRVPALGGTSEEPLLSPWLTVRIGGPAFGAGLRLLAVLDSFVDWLGGLFRRPEPCHRVLNGDVDVHKEQDMTARRRRPPPGTGRPRTPRDFTSRSTRPIAWSPCPCGCA